MIIRSPFFSAIQPFYSRPAADWYELGTKIYPSHAFAFFLFLFPATLPMIFTKIIFSHLSFSHQPPQEESWSRMTRLHFFLSPTIHLPPILHHFSNYNHHQHHTLILTILSFKQLTSGFSFVTVSVSASALWTQQNHGRKNYYFEMTYRICIFFW